MDTKTFVFEHVNIIPMDEERVLYDRHDVYFLNREAGYFYVVRLTTCTETA